MSDVLDPNTLTSAAFNRRVFVGLSASAAAVVSAGAAGGAPALGEPHAPIVAPDDPAIEARQIALGRPGVTLDAYAAWPASAATATPGIVLVQHIWGIDATLRDAVRRYAKAGFICAAPNLYARSRVPSGDGATDADLFRPAAAALVDDVVHGDLSAARDWIATKAPRAKIGISGFCMGGGIALKQLIGTTDYGAASIFYGDVRPSTPRSAPSTATSFAYAARRISTPMRGNYGARDTSIAPADVRTLYSLLREPHECDIYPTAGHAFFDDTRRSYVASAADDAWTKTLAWFNRFLA